MKINNKIVRFLVSFIITTILYYCVTFLSTRGSVNEVFKIMLVHLIFSFYLSIPIIAIIIYKINNLLTPIKQHSKEKTLRNKKILKFAIGGIVLLVLIILFTLSSS